MANTQLYLILLIAFNILLTSHAQYKKKEQAVGDNRAVLRKSYELQCNYNGPDDDGQFVEWYKDDVAVGTEKPGHYVVRNSGKESRLIIKIFVLADALVKEWYVKTHKDGHGTPEECRFSPIILKSSPQGIETNRNHEQLDSAHGSLRRNEDESITIKCVIEPKPDDMKSVHWKFGKDEQSLTNLENVAGVDLHGDEIRIEHVKKIHRGYYRCTHNDVSFTVLLRVKDRLAALWPFIGILCVVLVLVIVILIFEKRAKSTRKTVTTDDDENDHANDPLVRSQNKTSDNESKKRAVKA